MQLSLDDNYQARLETVAPQTFRLSLYQTENQR